MKSVGERFELEAIALIKAQGLQVIAQNFSSKYGEIDIIALEAGALVFLEVRSRSNIHFQSAAGSVNPAKQKRIIRTAQYFLQRKPMLAHLPCRFDVIAFQPPQSPSDSRIRWIRGAFTA